MKKILLVCAAGMSTSMLVKRMNDHANVISLEVNISALAIAEAKREKLKITKLTLFYLARKFRFRNQRLKLLHRGKCL
ncbi:cellobiose-specific phosphotransferase enzyme IIB component [Escherichia coli]|uniref:Cellobiose-specific phosphotransferase enzyme IIB component n=1 Tax=Escherichia coli TaxID=562 RepID=A0A377D622_ECOLX|nr:cellobiose-specific phosphotransferase enzyme IIB component [Escherichia coli]